MRQIIQWNHLVGVIEGKSQELLTGIIRYQSVLKMNVLLLTIMAVMVVMASLQELCCTISQLGTKMRIKIKKRNGV